MGGATRQNTKGSGKRKQLAPYPEVQTLSAVKERVAPQELTYWAEGSPEHQLRRNTLDAIPSLYEDAFNDPGDGWEGSGALGHAVTSPGDSLGPSPMSSPGQPPVSPGDPAHILHGASPGPSQKDSGKASEDGSSIFSVKGISSELPLPFALLPVMTNMNLYHSSMSNTHNKQLQSG